MPSCLKSPSKSFVVRLCLALFCCHWVVAANPILPADDSAVVDVSGRINAEVRAKWQAEGISPSGPAAEDEFLRRVMLDLAGRIPTLAELNDHETDAAPEKRRRLVEALLDSPDFAFHQRNELDLLLLARLTTNQAWRDYLLAATRENRSWDQIFKEVVLPEVHQPENEGTAAFLRERVRELDDLTNDTAVLFFGVNISCAKCHDHPLVADWQQDHYFGMASFFQRTYRTKSNFIGEKFDGTLSFKTVTGEEKPARFMFLTGTTIDEPDARYSADELKALQEAVKKAQREDDAQPPPQPEFSPRGELVRLALEDDEKRYFARNIVNRTWCRLMGRGFVEPLDQMHSDNPPSHPELLDWLALDLEQHGYDLKRLIAGIVLSEPYALSSRWTGAERPRPALFAVGRARPLTPRQFALSTIVATLNPAQSPGLSKPDDWSQKREDWENRSNQLAGQLPIPDENFQVSVEEALMFSNNDQISSEYLGDSADRLIGAVKQLDPNEQKLDTIFRAVLSRFPTDEERTRIAQYVADRSDREVAAWRQVLWALLTSPEFRFNH